jgi:BlaI family transcriptional regulator, penicillinase repressor
MKNAQPSSLELQVLSVLWENGPTTAREMLEALPDGKKRAYTTVLSVLQVMEKKGLVKHTTEGVTHVYKSVAKKRQVLRPMLRDMVSNVFGGSASSAMQHLLEENDISGEELDEIRAVLKNYAPKKESKKGAKS